MYISVIGAGGWGTALAVLLFNNGHKVTLWEYNDQYCKELIKCRENKLFLPGINIPEEIKITNSLDEAVYNKNLIVLAVPSQYLRSVIVKINIKDIQNSIIVNVAKGIEKVSLLTMSGVIKDVFKGISEDQISTLSGPSHAEEVAKKIATAVVVASKNIKTAVAVQSAFINSYFRVYSSNDIIGVELGGSTKNVIAIGAGIIDGANLGDNTKAAILTRGIAEISRLGIALGAKPETFAGLSGIGDLIVTCMSKHSRNRYVGEQIGKGLKLKDIISKMNMVAEGVDTAISVKSLAEKYKIELPICFEVYKILFEDKDPVQATYDLMTRDMKPEIYW